jgi:7 transmembrane helices usually fused to an inactive transglutaminase/Inactive transglutaminase fused to 7 transmembrane helices
MNAHRQIIIIVALLVFTGVSMIAYKHLVLGFPLLSSETDTVWNIESRLDFEALGGPVKARLNLPDSIPGAEILYGSEVSSGYVSGVKQDQGEAFFEWSREDALPGGQSVFLRYEVFFREQAVVTQDKPPETIEPTLNDVATQIQNDFSEALAREGFEGEKLVLKVLREINNPSSQYLDVLLRDTRRRSDQLELAINLLALEGIPARMVRGVLLEDRQKDRSALFMLKAWMDGQWKLYDPRESRPVDWNQFIVFQEDRSPLFEIEGGENSSLKFSVLREQRAAFMTAVEDAHNNRSLLVDFSIYSLPVAQQSTFKLLLLMPLGALVVVILRNLVGIRTSGTFMPILITLAFLQTGLLIGLALFLMVVGTGLIVRSYLTRLNLLLVPRIAAVLVVVIIIYGAIGIAGHKLGFEWGLSVTVFPMIILSWTIERMSILWDEEGAHEVMIQGGGSLLTASLAYLLMSNQIVADSIFLYPEALLVLLAMIIAIGSYSGYRLSDLRRFEPMERY